MDNHPIPQDVTGFKFKLIGSVTLKQFLYLVGGGILAVIFFMIPLPGFIKFPISFICGGMGAALAFVPIDGRPMDVMMKNFLKALPAENQFIYRKKGAETLIAQFFVPQMTVAAKPVPQQNSTTSSLDAKRALLYKTLRKTSQADDREQQALSNITSYLHEASHSATPPIQNIDNPPQKEVHSPLTQVVVPPESPPIKEPANQPTNFVPQKTNVQIVAPKPTSDMKEISNLLTKPTIVTPLDTPVAKPAPQIQTVEAPQFETQQQFIPPAPVTTSSAPSPAHEPATTEPQTAQSPSAATTPIAAPVAPPTTAVPIEPNQTANVTSVTPDKSLKAGFPQLPDVPNVVMGIIKDPRGRVLPNILVEFVDKDGVPVRAFKTNALGQFAAATPLPNGEYNVLLEDPRKQNEFEQIHISLSGQIFEPLEIHSVDQREKLRRELFGNAQSNAQMAT